MNIEELKKPLDPKHVASRSQAGQNLSYIESWHAIAEANRIFGFDGWSSETCSVQCVSERERKIGREPKQRDGWGVTYTAKVRVTVGDVVREGCGAGAGIDVDLGLAHESAVKEAESDARKRALMTFGNPFGLALYDKSRANVQAPPPPVITDTQREEMELLCDNLSFPVGRVLDVKKISDLRQMPAASFAGAMKWIADEAKKMEIKNA